MSTWIDPQNKEAREIYKLMIGLIGPRPIGWISSVSKEGKQNLAPYSFFNMFSMNPAVVAFAAALNRSGYPKDSYTNAVESGCFVHNVVTEDLVEPMNASSADWERGVSEFEKVGLTSTQSKIVKAPRVKEAAVNLECEVIQTLSLGNEPGNGQMCFGKVVGIHINREIFAEDDLVDENKLALLSRLGRTNYMKFGEVFSLPRPEAK